MWPRRAAAGFVDATVRFGRQAADGMHSAIIQAAKAHER
jgi:hypothetical protein